MLKVLCVVDKEGTALDRLAKGVARYHDNLDYKVLAVHPKRPDRNELAAFEREATNADIIDWQYFRTAELLRSRYPWLASKKQILTHNNPYSVNESDWNGYDANVGNNQTIVASLLGITTKPVHYIPITVDADFWKFNPDGQWSPNRNVIMVANRIEAKKGILPVAIACADVGLNLILVGSISDMTYMDGIMATGNVRYFPKVSDEELRELYYKSTIHICNSVDNFESGTMPILEAMLCGVPVLTRYIGHVPDIDNGENMAVMRYEPNNVEAIAAELQALIYDKKRLNDLRERGWQSAKTRNFERRAYLYQKLYREVLHPGERPVSVIMPVYNNQDVMRRALDGVASQTYKNLEIIVADDNYVKPNKSVVSDFSQYVNCPVRYINTGTMADDYGLARARNQAAIEATGEILVFCDQRILMHPDAISEFVKNLAGKQWVYGYKGAKKEFVENFSAVSRADFMRAGMFAERINEYGGMSQEIRQRVRAQGMSIECVPSAVASAIGKSSNRNVKRASIIKMKNRLAKMYEL